MSEQNEGKRNDSRFKFDVTTVPGLDIEAFDRWIGYKRGRNQSYKNAQSERAAAVKLSQMGEDQAAAVDESISNNWAGVFPLKTRLMPGEKPKKTKQQIEADQARDDWLMKQAERHAQAAAGNPIGELRMLDGILARITLQQEDPSFGDRMEAFRNRVAERLSACDPAAAYGDPHVRSMVMQIWGARGVAKLERRAQEARKN